MNTNKDQVWRKVIDQVRTWARMNSIWAVHFNSGSCNGCDIEILATLTPRYDVERFGIKLQGSPRHADVLIVTGPVTRQARERLIRTYEQMPEPKFVISVGSCSISGGVFEGLQLRRLSRRSHSSGCVYPRLSAAPRSHH